GGDPIPARQGHGPEPRRGRGHHCLDDVRPEPGSGADDVEDEQDVSVGHRVLPLVWHPKLAGRTTASPAPDIRSTAVARKPEPPGCRNAAIAAGILVAVCLAFIAIGIPLVTSADCVDLCRTASETILFAGTPI